MKAGALIGTAFGPVGTVVGGIAGGLLGAFGGRAAANAVKRAPLESAKVQYDEALRAYRAQEAALVAEAGAAWKRVQDEQGRALLARVEHLRLGHHQNLQGLEARLRRSVVLDYGSAQSSLDGARSRITAAREHDHTALRRRIPAWTSIWAGLIAPAEAQACVQHKAEAREWERQVEKLLGGWTGSASDTSKCFDLVLAAPDGTASAEAHVLRSETVRMSVIADAATQHQQLLARAANERTEAVARLREGWDLVRGYLEVSLAPVIDSLRDSGEQLRQELRKSGSEV